MLTIIICNSIACTYFLWFCSILEAVYAYKDADDKLLGYVVRFVSKEDGKKQTLTVTYCYNAAKEEYSWRLKGFTDKGDKPIFGIEKAICSSKPILIVEGEKAAIAAAQILPEYSVVSWMGGSNAADKVNWMGPSVAGCNNMAR